MSPTKLPALWRRSAYAVAAAEDNDNSKSSNRGQILGLVLGLAAALENGWEIVIRVASSSKTDDTHRVNIRATLSDPFEREFRIIIDEFASPKARSRMLAGFAREQIEKTRVENETALGRTIRKPRVSVDGRVGAALSTVKLDGTIVAECNVEAIAVRWILHERELISPTLTGADRASHTVFADGRELTLSADGDIPNASEYVIVSTVPYAKKLDPKDGPPARSKQAPCGVYAAISAVAAIRFEEEATIRFTFRNVSASGSKTLRQPANSIRPV